jgi:hypothetical protein
MSWTTFTAFLRKALGEKPGLAWLFVSLLLFLLSYPVISDMGSLSLDILFSAMLIAGAYAVSRQRKVLVIAIVLALPTLALWWGVRVVYSTPAVLVGLLFSTVFFLFILVVLLKNVAQSEQADTDIIYAAMSAYLLIGVTWSFFYALVEIITPGAFDFGSLGADAEFDAPHGELRLFSYYSLVTLSTLGYGDITPVTPLARSLSAMEAVTGQLFIAVLLARLVGLHIAQKKKPED